MYYTKYRPQKFSETIKPDPISDALSTQVKNNKAGHAYLFVGPRGIGKTTTARILAKALNCEKIAKNGDPCDTCDSCTAIKVGNYLDLIEIDAASNRGIDDIRDLRDKINLAPTSGTQKVYIIDEVHMLTTEAFNALLKTLEEPPAHATFILCTTEDHKVPDTIKSRCQVFKFKRATTDQLVSKLEEITSAERVKSKFKKEELETIAKASHGGFRDAETLLQQVVEGELDIDSFVGTSSKQDYVDFVQSLMEQDQVAALRKINGLFDDGVDLHTWTMELLKYLRDLLFIVADAHEGLLDVTEDLFSTMEEQAGRLSPSEIAKMIDLFMRAQNDIKSSVIQQLPLELAVVKSCTGNNSGVVVTPQGGGGDTRNSGGPSTPKTPEVESRSKSNPKKSSKSKLNTPVATMMEAWQDVLKGAKVHNHGVSALLRSAKPISIEGSSVVLEVFYKFHKERLESTKNRQIVETVLSDVFGETIAIICELSEERPAKIEKKENLTDFNVEVTQDVTIGDALVDVFDGALPI